MTYTEHKHPFTDEDTDKKSSTDSIIENEEDTKKTNDAETNEEAADEGILLIK